MHLCTTWQIRKPRSRIYSLKCCMLPSQFCSFCHRCSTCDQRKKFCPNSRCRFKQCHSSQAKDITFRHTEYV